MVNILAGISGVCLAMLWIGLPKKVKEVVLISLLWICYMAIVLRLFYLLFPFNLFLG